IIKSLCGRPTDLVARYGGEEIAVILPETDIDGANQLARTICTSIYNEAIPHYHSPSASVVTVSIGAGSIVPSKYSSPINFVTQVDKQLYHAKKQGRNQVSAIDLTNVTPAIRAS
ncbi:MAG: GGDEF domain-containing protein, partial [Gammaproteobacteria bacterium]|nr:GGDEF domain-containing protein [Gammaproteobacteria bacterium]